MASITIRKLSDETKERLRARADRHGSSLEAFVRAILDQAAQDLDPVPTSRFPHNLIALVEPGEDIESLIVERDERQDPVEL